jgi:hypothetical protein
MKGAEHGYVGADSDREHSDDGSGQAWSFPKTPDREAYIVLQRHLFAPTFRR